jgi:hypothetical protein
MNRKMSEFFGTEAGEHDCDGVYEQVQPSAQYAGTHVNTDEKRDRFFSGLSCILQKELYTGGYRTFGALMNVVIAMEGLQRDSQAE